MWLADVPAAASAKTPVNAICLRTDDRTWSRRMRFVCVTLALAFAVASPIRSVAAPELLASKPEVKKAVIAVIEAQLAAFRSGNVTRAYEYAAASLRAQTSLRAFAAILKSNYPEIWTNKRAEYGLVRDDGTRARVLVQVIADTGEATFDYVLIRERSGWRIGSVMRHDPRKKGNA